MTSTLPSTKTDFVYQTLRSEILDGRVQPGQRLRLAELAGRYQISEMPVREALRKLQHDGLVQFENHRGAMVSDLGLERIIEIIATRTYLETCAVIEALPHHTRQSIEQLKALIARMKRAHDPDEYSELNRKFHRLLAEPCPNAFLKSEIDSLWNKVWRTRSQSIFQLIPTRISRATAEHQAILDAVIEKSADKVRELAMIHRQHTLDSWRSLAQAPAEASSAPAARRGQ